MNRNIRRLAAALLMVLGSLAPAQPARANPQTRLDAAIYSIGFVRSAPLTPIDVTLMMRFYGFRVLWHQTHSLTPEVCILKQEIWLQSTLVVPVRIGECRIRVWAVSIHSQEVNRHTRASAVLVISVRRGPVHEGDIH